MAAVLAAALFAFAAAPARADGDPPSDYLLSQQVYTPFGAKLDPVKRQRLQKAVANANRAGYRIRVAVIGSVYDLGSVTVLWRKPRTYAHFLGEELAFVYHNRLLVVMQNGFGFNYPKHSSAKAYRILSRISIQPDPDGLLQAALRAVQRLAAAKA